MTKVENSWRYLENFCVFESNKSIVLINNTKTIPKKRFPTEFYTWYYKRYLYFRDENRTAFPESVLSSTAPIFSSHAVGEDGTTSTTTRSGSTISFATFITHPLCLAFPFVLLLIVDGECHVLSGPDSSECYLRRPKRALQMVH